jgi:sulfur carrier protein ThiS
MQRVPEKSGTRSTLEELSRTANWVISCGSNYFARSLMPAAFRSSTVEDTIAIELRFVSNVAKFSQSTEKVEVAAETTIEDLIARYGLQVGQIARVLCNGRDMNPGNYTGGNLDLGASIADGDVITFSGPAPSIPGTRSSAF